MRLILCASTGILLSAGLCFFERNVEKTSAKYPVENILPETPKTGYKEIYHPTPNFDSEKVNDVQGIILHHTAEPTIERSLAVLTSSQKKVGTHVVIDTDGTRYIMAEPRKVVFHAGKSILGGREACNEFTIGIELQGNTLESPLTQDQIDSAIEYMLPLIREYNIPVSNIVTHEMIRQAYKRKYPNTKCYDKVDITQKEYRRFMKRLYEVLETQPK
ncbi:MAG: N-acetylmuramoyl-L-alanine amidase [Alloprevotella sp.]|nr:N-acetylmuramoyl-L-alanine amidase [Alloprevotella sp.]